MSGIILIHLKSTLLQNLRTPYARHRLSTNGNFRFVFRPCQCRLRGHRHPRLHRRRADRSIRSAPILVAQSAAAIACQLRHNRARRPRFTRKLRANQQRPHIIGIHCTEHRETSDIFQVPHALYVLPSESSPQNVLFCLTQSFLPARLCMPFRTR